MGAQGFLQAPEAALASSDHFTVFGRQALVRSVRVEVIAAKLDLTCVLVWGTG